MYRIITWLVELLTGGMLASLIVLNWIVMDRTRKRRRNMCLAVKHSKILGIKNNAKDDSIVKKDLLRMHDGGTDLKEENSRLTFIPFSIMDKAEFFWNGNN